VNIIGTLHLIDLCYKRGLHVTNYATGCIYNFEESGEHAMGGRPFKEEDKPNWFGSFYSQTKVMLEEVCT
jgi:nucleoside-diphosphate-sugar epimerase